MKPYYRFSHRDESNQLHWQAANQDRPHCDATWFWGRADPMPPCPGCSSPLCPDCRPGGMQ